MCRRRTDRDHRAPSSDPYSIPATPSSDPSALPQLSSSTPATMSDIATKLQVPILATFEVEASDIEELVKQLSAIVAAEVASATAPLRTELAAAKAKVAAKPLTKSGGARKANPYSKMLSTQKHLKPGEREQYPALATIEVTPVENFSPEAAKTIARYNECKEAMLHNGAQVVGQTMTLAELYDALKAPADGDNKLGNTVCFTPILWGLLNSDTRKQVQDTAVELGLITL